MKYNNLLVKSAIVALVFGSVSAHAGQGVGNGGDAVICYDRPISSGSVHGAKPRVLSVELLDYWEWSQKSKYTLDLGSATSYMDKARSVIERLRRVDELRYLRLKARLDAFSSNSNFISRSNIPEIDDAYFDLDLKPNCYTHQLARQKTNFAVGEAKFLIDQDLFASLPITHQAGLVLHEIFYEDAIAKGATDSDGARYFNFMMSSNRAVTVSLEEYVDWVSEAFDFSEGARTDAAFFVLPYVKGFGIQPNDILKTELTEVKGEHYKKYPALSLSISKPYRLRYNGAEYLAQGPLTVILDEKGHDPRLETINNFSVTDFSQGKIPLPEERTMSPFESQCKSISFDRTTGQVSSVSCGISMQWNETNVIKAYSAEFSEGGLRGHFKYILPDTSIGNVGQYRINVQEPQAGYESGTCELNIRGADSTRLTGNCSVIIQVGKDFVRSKGNKTFSFEKTLNGERYKYDGDNDFEWIGKSHLVVGGPYCLHSVTWNASQRMTAHGVTRDLIDGRGRDESCVLQYEGDQFQIRTSYYFVLDDEDNGIFTARIEGNEYYPKEWIRTGDLELTIDRNVTSNELRLQIGKNYADTTCLGPYAACYIRASHIKQSFLGPGPVYGHLEKDHSGRFWR